jgi:hypothetical protein
MRIIKLSPKDVDFPNRESVDEYFNNKLGILHVRPKVVYTFCDFEKTPFFLICNIFLQNQHVTGD